MGMALSGWGETADSTGEERQQTQQKRMMNQHTLEARVQPWQQKEFVLFCLT
jgi:hypothetical protein